MHNNILKNKKVVITGCAGFIPSHLTAALLELGALVMGVDDLSKGKIENMSEFLNNKNFKFHKTDVRNIEEMTSVIKGANYVYHGAVSGIGGSVANPLYELDVNTRSTLSILEIIKKNPVKRFVYPSSASVYGNPEKFPESESDPTNPTSPYGISKLAAENYCLLSYKLFNIPVVALRYFNTYGPKQSADSTYGGVVSIFLKNILLKKPLKIYGDGSQTRDFTYIKDIIQATVAAFTSPDIIGAAINLSAGREYSVIELAQRMISISGSKSEITHEKPRKVDNIQRRYGDISMARKKLGYNPIYTLEAGLKETFNWAYKNSGSVL